MFCVEARRARSIRRVAFFEAMVCVISLNASGAPTASPAQNSNSIAGWGEVINPDGDCKVTTTDGKLTMALPGNDHALRPERQKMNAPRVMQEVGSEFDIQVKVSGDFAPTPKSVVPGRPGYQDAGLLVWVDDKNNLKLSRARIAAQGKVWNYFNLEFRHDGEVGEIPMPKEAKPLLQADAVYLRLRIHTAETTAGVSSDGKNWITMSLPSGDLPEKMHAGVLAENNTSSPFNAVCEGFTLSKNTAK